MWSEVRYEMHFVLLYVVFFLLFVAIAEKVEALEKQLSSVEDKLTEKLKKGG